MIFERLTIHQFQRYRGTSTIEFPEPNAEKSIVLVLAPNGSGKTTVLRALRFLLYGDLTGHDRDSVWNLANDLIRDRSEVGENIEIWIEARVIIGDGDPLTIRREFQIRKVAPNRWTTEGPFLLSRKSDLGNEQFLPDADGSLQVRIDADVPQDLFSWFHFAGEPAEGRMSHGRSRTLIEPLKKAIQLRRWSAAISNADHVVEKLRRKLRTESQNHGAYADLRHRKDVVSRDKGKKQQDLTILARELRDLQTEQAQLDTRCREVSEKAAESQKLYKRLKDQEQKKSRAQDALDQARAEIRTLVARSAGLPLLEPSLPEIERRLAELRAANLLPADISKGFIERLMKSPKCVCGNCIDDEALEELRSYMAKTLASRTNNDLTNLANDLEGGKGSRLRASMAEYPGKLQAALGRKADAVRDFKEAEQAVKDLKPQVEESSIEEFKRAIRERDRVGGEVTEKKNLIQELERSIQRQEETLRNLNAEIARARPRRGGGNIEKLEAAIDVAEKLAENLRVGRQRFQDAVYDLLQDRLSQHFDKTVSGGTRAKLDRETLMPKMVDANGNVVTAENAGGGEMQVLSIAFVAGLAELRSRINRDLKEAGLGGRLLGEQAFVIDSPFTSADHNYMKGIAKFLPDKAPQLLVLIAKQNWPDTVRETLEPHIASAYGITLHTPAEAHDPGSFEFQVNGHSVNLREELDEDEPIYSTFNKIF